MKADSLFLIGMRGSGKSSVGKKLASVLNYTFVDTDLILQEEAGETIDSFVKREGWDAFRQRERAVLLAQLGSHLVIGTGGGIILDDLNCQFMREQGTIFFLDVPPAVLAKRLQADRGEGGRPSLTGADMIDELTTVHGQRIEKYRRTAHFCIDGNTQPQEIVENIVKIFKGL